MATTYSCLHYHIIFSTKDREPRVSADVRQRLYDFIGGITRAEKATLVAIGGTSNHLHLLIGMGTEPSLAAMVNRIKANSSRWMNETFPGNPRFEWQRGYGAFAVSKSNIPEVKDYIENQTEHHRTKSFAEELIAFLQRHEIEYDERWLMT
jgi:putative transposase